MNRDKRKIANDCDHEIGKLFREITITMSNINEKLAKAKAPGKSPRYIYDPDNGFFERFDKCPKCDNPISWNITMKNLALSPPKKVETPVDVEVKDVEKPKVFKKKKLKKLDL